MLTKQRNRDGDLTKTINLPAAASTSVVTAPIDIGLSNRPRRIEMVLEIPALGAGIIPDTRTVTLTIEDSVDLAFSSPRTTRTIDLTGAGGAGIPASELRAQVSQNESQFVRGKITFGASTTSGAAFFGTFALAF